MNPLTVVHKNENALSRLRDPAFRKLALELLDHQRALNRKKAEKKFGVVLDHLKY